MSQPSEQPFEQTNVRPIEQVILVSSPKAGTGAHRDQLPVLHQMLTDAGIRSVQTTSIDELKRCLDDGPSLRSNPFGSVVVAAGGDGTLSLVASHVAADVPLVPMPLGTENLLARYYGYRPTAACLFDAIRRGHSYRMDAGRANGKLFLVMASCGFDAEVVRGLHLKRRGHINRFSYARPIWRALRRYSFPKIQVDRTTRTVDLTQNADASATPQETDSPDAVDDHFTDGEFGWAMVFNLPRYGGGMMIERDAVGTDGELDLIAFRKRSIASGLRYVGGVLVQGHTLFSDVLRGRVRTLRLTSDERVPYQLDGDYAGRLPLTIETLPRRIHLLLPAVDPQQTR